MLKQLCITLVLFALLAGVSSAQYGYGTSNITLSRYSVIMLNGGTANVNYSVNLASGSTWGTTLSVNDSSYLLSQGIEATLSKFQGNPTYMGNMTITVSPSTPKGHYAIVLQATGDDPSAHNTTLTLIVAAPNTTVITVITPSNLTNATTVAATVAPTTAPTTVMQTSQESGYQISSSMAELLIGVILSLIVAIALTFTFRGAPTRLAIWGIALIVIGTILWLYGDYSGFLMPYVWSGVGLLFIGIIVWIAGDAMAGAYKSMEVPTLLDITGVILLIVGILIWLYGDYYAAGASPYTWSGVGLIALGAILWIIGNGMSGAFKRKHPKK